MLRLLNDQTPQLTSLASRIRLTSWKLVEIHLTPIPAQQISTTFPETSFGFSPDGLDTQLA